jgi:hypothetical protein
MALRSTCLPFFITKEQHVRNFVNSPLMTAEAAKVLADISSEIAGREDGTSPGDMHDRWSSCCSSRLRRCPKLSHREKVSIPERWTEKPCPAYHAGPCLECLARRMMPIIPRRLRHNVASFQTKSLQNGGHTWGGSVVLFASNPEQYRPLRIQGRKNCRVQKSALTSVVKENWSRTSPLSSSRCPPTTSLAFTHDSRAN